MSLLLIFLLSITMNLAIPSNSLKWNIIRIYPLCLACFTKHVAPMLQHVSEFHCFLCLNSILLYADFTFRVYIHMITSGLFPLLTIVNNVAMIEKNAVISFYFGLSSY